MATNPRQQGRPGGGDYTGRQKAAANKEALQADQDRHAQMSMATAQQTEDEQHGVFDAQSGERLDNHVAVEIEDEDPDAPEAAFFGFPGNDGERVLTGKESPEELAPVLAQRKQFTRASASVAPSAIQRIRVDMDIDDMTYGMTVNGEPNNFTFKEGLQYDVPYAVAEHLNQLGLVRQFIRT